MKRKITDAALKIINNDKMLMKKLDLKSREELSQINPFKIIETAIRDWINKEDKIIAMFERAEKYEKRIAKNEDITEESRNGEAKRYSQFLKHIDYFYDKQANVHDELELYHHLKKEYRREDLDKYFISKATKYTSPVYVFEGEDGELRLLQMYYAINYYMFKHMQWRGIAQESIPTDPLQQKELAKEAHSWGKKEWVQMQVDKVENEEMRAKLKEYKYQTYLAIFFPQSGEGRLVSVDIGKITKGFGNIKLD